MALTTEDYKSFSITVNEQDDQATELKINDRVIPFQIFDDGKCHTEIIPYQNFGSPSEMAKYIIDNVPNFEA